LKLFPTKIVFGDKMIYNRKRNRLHNYDYSTPGYYFVTICTKGMLEYFGRVQNNEMELNNKGCIVQKCWLDLPNHYKNCKLHAFVIMPNHIHGIIEIVGNGFKPFQNESTTNKRNGLKPFPTYGLSEIMRGFKTFSSKNINQKSKHKFTWQKSFYDHIIRNDGELIRISDYIGKNPLLWKQDEYFIKI